MSEKEILRRQKYKESRKKWVMIQVVALTVVIAVALGCFLIYDRMNRTYYIEYTENSTVDYQVQYRETEFFEDPWLGEERTYISALIEDVLADFHYEMRMNSANVGFDYTYRIDAQVTVADKDTGKPFYTVEEEVLPCRQVTTKNGGKVRIDEQAQVDFQHFNEIAAKFTSVYGLKNTTSTLSLTLYVQVLSSCDQFEKNNENSYTASVHIPLNEETMFIHSTASAPAGTNKVLAYQTFVSKQVFLVAGYVAAGLALLMLLGLFIFMHLTKNEDVTYTARVRRLLNAYSSFIQRMEGEFDDSDYQILPIKTFNELLGIRDTLQAPILMTENKDQTKSRFLIPTSARLLYAFEIRVDNYDEIYDVSTTSAQNNGGAGRYLK